MSIKRITITISEDIYNTLDKKNISKSIKERLLNTENNTLKDHIKYFLLLDQDNSEHLLKMYEQETEEVMEELGIEQKEITYTIENIYKVSKPSIYGYKFKTKDLSDTHNLLVLENKGFKFVTVYYENDREGYFYYSVPWNYADRVAKGNYDSMNPKDVKW